MLIPGKHASIETGARERSEAGRDSTQAQFKNISTEKFAAKKLPWDCLLATVQLKVGIQEN